MATPTDEGARRAIVLTANMPKIGVHMSGSAIDISVFHRDDGTDSDVAPLGVT
jgi:hypothetical protein